MKKILIVTGDACEALEVLYPKFRMEEEGWTVHVAAPTKKTLFSVVHDFEPHMETYTEKPAYRIEADLAFPAINPSDYDGLIIPGGRAPEYIRNDRALPRIVQHFFDAGKPVAATCHAVLILLKGDHVKGRTMAAYPQLACDVEKTGGKFKDQTVVVDGNLISARAWPDNGPWIGEFVKAVKARGG